ncbi:MAG: sugar phosphate isomerase/epimerase family protein [Anaerolineae bacterium]
MKLAIQEGMLPGESLPAKLAAAESWGFEGIELSQAGLPERLPDVRSAFAGRSIRVSTICGSGRQDIVTADAAERGRRAASVRMLLDCAGELGAEGLVFVPIRQPERLPDLTPLYGERQLAEEMCVAILGDLASYAAARGTRLLLEPLIRYEAWFVRSLPDAAAICGRVDSPGLAVMGDLFHMATEEDDVPTSIRLAGAWLRHIHLADSNRLQPGTGHTDFVAAFRALRDGGYDGYMALECSIRGDHAVALPETAGYLRRCIAEAARR